MDRERLGRVLGRGARLAAQTALEAVDAATAQSPGPRARRSSAPVVTVLPPTVKQPAGLTPATSLLRAAKGAGKGFASPLRRASRALWLELTGCFFALFALSFGLGVWHTRAEAFSPLPVGRHRFTAFCLLALLFAYFSVSSFVRARRVTAAG